jgi:hypothetical protein
MSPVRNHDSEAVRYGRSVYDHSAPEKGEKGNRDSIYALLQ